MPHLRLRKAAATAPPAEHHHTTTAQRFWRMERAFDYLVVAGIVIIGGVMLYGLATASGDVPWL